MGFRRSLSASRVLSCFSTGNRAAHMACTHHTHIHHTLDTHRIPLLRSRSLWYRRRATRSYTLDTHRTPLLRSQSLWYRRRATRRDPRRSLRCDLASNGWVNIKKRWRRQTAARSFRVSVVTGFLEACMGLRDWDLPRNERWKPEDLLLPGRRRPSRSRRRLNVLPK